METKKARPDHLAWHETLELHELVASQAVGLMKLKKGRKEIDCEELRMLYNEAIQGLEKNIHELLAFFPAAPVGREDETRHDDDLRPFFAGDLLAFAKTSVRNYAIAITETATPMVRATLTEHLLVLIQLHAKVFEYMYSRSFYPAYNLSELLKNDVTLAGKALKMR